MSYVMSCILLNGPVGYPEYGKGVSLSHFFLACIIDVKKKQTDITLVKKSSNICRRCGNGKIGRFCKGCKDLLRELNGYRIYKGGRGCKGYKECKGRRCISRHWKIQTKYNPPSSSISKIVVCLITYINKKNRY